MKKTIRIFLLMLISAYFFNYISTYKEWHFIDNVNVIFYEAGHTLFFFFGNFMNVFMGSGFQVLLPLLISIYFFLTYQRISGSVVLMWVGQNIINVSLYASDAVARQLPLLGGGTEGHDWNYILARLNLLEYTDQISKAIYHLGVAIIVIGVIFSAYFIAVEEE